MKRLKGNKMNNSIYIDAGGHTGQSIERFKQMSMDNPNSKIYSFECHPRCYEVLKSYETNNIHVSNKAVWIEDGEIEFFLDMLDEADNPVWPHDYPGQASTISEVKAHRGIDGQFNIKSKVKVPCFDFSKWILENFKVEDYIFLKMDIEGSEYNVLEEMVKTGAINLINDLDIEFHWHKVGLEKQVHDYIVDELKKTNVNLNIRSH